MGGTADPSGPKECSIPYPAISMGVDGDGQGAVLSSGYCCDYCWLLLGDCLGIALLAGGDTTARCPPRDVWLYSLGSQ